MTLRWKDGEALDAMQRSVEQGGEAVAWEGLGWDGPVQTHRPFLSYAELGALVDEPSGCTTSWRGSWGWRRWRRGASGWRRGGSLWGRR